MFADDTSVIFYHKSYAYLENQIELFFCKLKCWCDKNLMIVNGHKTKAMLFGYKSTDIFGYPKITYDGVNVQYVNEFKLLGVWFESSMRWNKHVRMVCRTLALKIGIINRARSVLPTKVKVELYYSLIYSVLNYCFLVWGTTTASNLMRLFLLQKRMIRIIDNAPYYSHTGELFLKYRIKSVNNLYVYKLGISLRRQNPFFLDLFALVNNINNSYPLRHRSFYIPPMSRINICSTRLCNTVTNFLNHFHASNIVWFVLNFSVVKEHL